MQNQRGSIIVFSLILLAIMLAIGTSLVGTLVIKLRTTTGASNSTVAVYAADSAEEVCLFEARKGKAFGRTTLPDGNQTILTNGSFFAIASASMPAVDITKDCTMLFDSTFFKLRVLGTYKNTTRALEILQ